MPEKDRSMNHAQPSRSRLPLRGQEIPVSGVSGVCRNGQVFLTWAEQATPANTTFNVYQHVRPIVGAEFVKARRLAHHIEPFSARDYWQDPATFSKSAKPGVPIGFRIASGAAPLPPNSGLFVHTVTDADQGPRYYAVTATLPEGREEATLVPGANSLEQPVSGSVAPVQPIWVGDGASPAAGAGKGKLFALWLHGRGGGDTTSADGSCPTTCLVFGDATQGWREGLAFKFYLRMTDHAVLVTPYDRAWTGGRPVLESKDERDHCAAVNTFWYGYNSRIYETTLAENPVVPNYTEKYLLWIVQWAQSHFGTDRSRTYLRGCSMGASGAVALALHYPEAFAAVSAQVPIYAYTRPGTGTAWRLECACGPLDRPAVTHAGVPLLDHMHGARQVASAVADLTPVFATNGRQDGSIPWENNPPFYQAMNKARQAFAVYWNDGGHGMSQDAPPDVKAWDETIERYRLDESFPAFSNCSDNGNYGGGDPKDGDLVGWVNRGLGWRELVDTPGEYALTVTADHPEIQYPVIVDVTPRRIQQFNMAPGEMIQVRVGNQPPAAARADAAGRVTVARVRIESRDGTRICLTRLSHNRTPAQ